MLKSTFFGDFQQLELNENFGKMARFLSMVQIGNQKQRMIFIPSLVKSSYGGLTLLLHHKIDPKKHCSIKDIYKMKRTRDEEHQFFH